MTQCWKWADIPSGKGKMLVDQEVRRVLVTAGFPDRDDRNLIAAAPDLLAATALALHVLTTCRNDLAASGAIDDDDGEICAEAQSLTPAITKLQNAMSKAKGGAH